MSNENQPNPLGDAIAYLERAVLLGKTTVLSDMNQEDRQRHIEVLADCEKQLESLNSLRRKITQTSLNSLN